MKFQCIIDKHAEEEILVRAKKRTPLIDQIEALVTAGDRIAGYTEEDDIVMLPFAAIECITVLEGKTFAIDSTGKRYRLRQRLYELEELLPDHFIRINKSSLANETRLARFTASFSGAVDAVFRCGYREYVSRRCFAEIKRRYDL